VGRGRADHPAGGAERRPLLDRVPGARRAGHTGAACNRDLRGQPFTFFDGDWPTEDGLHPWAGRACWTGHGALTLQRPGDAYAVWAFWTGPERDFSAWYVNFQEPFRRTERGFDTQDLELDLIVYPDGSWELKDDELLDVRVRQGRFTEDQARATRAEADRVIADLAAGRRWWDDAWAQWRPGVG
jgi:hypothetical protein